MNERSKTKRPKMVYEVMDIYNMTYKDASFDVILDKGNTQTISQECSISCRCPRCIVP